MASDKYESMPGVSKPRRISRRTIALILVIIFFLSSFIAVIAYAVTRNKENKSAPPKTTVSAEVAAKQTQVQSMRAAAAKKINVKFPDDLNAYTFETVAEASEAELGKTQISVDGYKTKFTLYVLYTGTGAEAEPHYVFVDGNQEENTAPTLLYNDGRFTAYLSQKGLDTTLKK